MVQDIQDSRGCAVAEPISCFAVLMKDNTCRESNFDEVVDGFGVSNKQMVKHLLIPHLEGAQARHCFQIFMTFPQIEYW